MHDAKQVESLMVLYKMAGGWGLNYSGCSSTGNLQELHSL